MNFHCSSARTIGLGFGLSLGLGLGGCSNATGSTGGAQTTGSGESGTQETSSGESGTQETACGETGATASPCEEGETGTGDGDGDAETETGGGNSVDLSLMSFNIRIGGIGESTQDLVDVINAGEVDIVGLQEAGTRGQALADALGWNYSAGDLDVAYLSRFPISAELTSGVRVTLCEGFEATVGNVHLAPYPYGPYDLRDDPSLTEAQLVQSANDARGADLTNVISQLAGDVDAGAPVFMLGDFNEPSHLDWTAAAASASLHFGAEVAWPASLQMDAAGYVDAYRVMHPNEVDMPGDTWTPRPSGDEVHDRIDFVYGAGAATQVTRAVIVGESEATSDVAVDPFPSDHRAIAATFRVPAPPGCEI